MSDTRRFEPRFHTAAALALILVSSLLLKLNNLDHAGIKALDESFHAVVSKNLINNPLKPTLYEQPWLPYDYRDWQSNHVWLHKPIVPLWQMAASMALFGVNTLALRLPSALLATAAVWLTYAIGVELLRDRRAALIAATFQAFNPAITSLVHGYVFSDHIDIALLFWVELSIWLLVRSLRSGSTRWIIAAGVAQGIAYHCKTYPAFIVTGIALVAWLLPRLNLLTHSPPHLRLRDFLLFLCATLIAIAPWTIWCLIHFPREFAFEQLQVFRHLTHDVEQWAAPWDRLIFDFSLRIYYLFYPAVLAAAVIMLIRAYRQRSIALWLIHAWAFGVLIPFALAASKTPSATLIGWPAFYLLLGAMIARALDGDATSIGAWLGATMLAIAAPGSIPRAGWGYPDPQRFAGIMRENIWVLWHVLAALAIALASRVALRDKFQRPALRIPVILLATLATCFLFTRLMVIGYRVTAVNRQHPSFIELGELTRLHLPHNTVFLLENNEKLEHIIAMFHLDRSVYPVAPDTWQATAARIESAGGVPLLATRRRVDLPLAIDRPIDNLNIYAIGSAPESR